MRLMQLRLVSGERCVGVSDDGGVRRLNGVETTYALAQEAIGADCGLAKMVHRLGLGPPIDWQAALADGRALPPLDHADPAHLHMTGTGLTHLGSATARDRMHAAGVADAGLSDSMKMFRMGSQGGKPKGGETGVQPEWFYKGDGSSVAAPEQALESPDFALDGGEEPEIAGLYVIGPDGSPFRLGFALANEFSDHVTERQNYLFLAHSKLRPAAFGPELLVGDLPADVRGVSRIRREGATVWEGAFLSGEENMTHSAANLEHHHFKYDLFRRPGDVHVHFFGTATLSFDTGFRAAEGDVFEIEAEGFGAPLRNRLAVRAVAAPVVRAL